MSSANSLVNNNNNKLKKKLSISKRDYKFIAYSCAT